MLKITAKKAIRIYANVVSQQTVKIAGTIAFRPKNSMEWVRMSPNEVREDISLVMGIDPKLMPHKQADLMGRNLYAVPLEETEEFQDLLLVEQAGSEHPQT
ncbi:MAG: hypothetical protein H7A55_07970 [Verrucomicrobiaceae bacterium]|nr:hypothetical protein [Verrucomicrobiaceae bacterium]